MSDYNPADPITYVSPDLLSLIRPIDDVKPAVVNSLVHTHDDLTAIADSLVEFGQREPLFINLKTNEISSGNGRWLAARNLLGWTHMAMIGEEDSEERSQRWNIAANATGRIAEFNFDTLKQAIDADSPIPGITPNFMAEIKAQFPETEPDNPPVAAESDSDEPEEDSRAGWQTFSIRLPPTVLTDLQELMAAIQGDEAWEKFANLITVLQQSKMENFNA